jgi:uncharacterized protein
MSDPSLPPPPRPPKPLPERGPGENDACHVGSGNGRTSLIGSPAAGLAEERYPRMRFLRSVFQHTQEESAQHAAEHSELDLKAVAVLLTTCVILTLQNYVFRTGTFEQLLASLEWLGAKNPAGWLGQQTIEYQDRQLAQLLFWVCGSIINYVIIPCLVIKLVLRERVADFGLSFRGILPGSWLYLVMFLCMIGPLVLASRTEAFQAKYPFYRLQYGEPLWPRLWIWEVAYIAQFFALEFFFRGFMVHGLRRRLGIYAIFVMTVPYCMIHYGKPMAETMGAIGAGIILGLMSLKTRSVWFGACLHVAVAMSMDFLSMWQKGMFG